MAYGRRRRSTRRTYRRGRRTLSTRNIFGNKSARAQARQISTLKRRISNVYRQCRPETKLKEGAVVTLNIPYDDLTPYALYTVDMPSPGIGDDQMVGNVCNIKDVHVYIDAEIDARYTAPQYALYGGMPGNLSYRIITFATKVLSDNSPAVPDILVAPDYNTNVNEYMLNSVRPLNEGISSKYDILYDRTFRLTNAQVSRKHHILVKGSRIRKYVNSQYMNFGKAQLYVLLVPVLSFPEEILDVSSPPINPITIFRIMDKIAYTDP